MAAMSHAKTQFETRGSGSAAITVVVSQWFAIRQFQHVQRPAFHELSLRLESHSRLAHVLRRHRQGSS
jgi:hypothetical protein